MNTTKKDLSVIIVNYKSERYLERCLTSLLNATPTNISLEIIIVNNDAKESLKRTQSSFPQIHILPNPKNGGFGQGNNLGANHASGKHLLLLNPDTEIISGSLEQILQQFYQNPNLGIIGCCLMTEEGKIQEWSAGEKVTIWDVLKNNLGILGSRKTWESTSPVITTWVAGTALFISSELFQAVGGFDEQIFMYFEDVDLCEKVNQKGKRILYDPSFKVLHKCGGSYSDDKKKQQKQNYYDSMVYYFQKHRPKWEHFIIKTLRKLFFS